MSIPDTYIPSEDDVRSVTEAMANPRNNPDWPLCPVCQRDINPVFEITAHYDCAQERARG